MKRFPFKGELSLAGPLQPGHDVASLIHRFVENSLGRRNRTGRVHSPFLDRQALELARRLALIIALADNGQRNRDGASERNRDSGGSEPESAPMIAASYQVKRQKQPNSRKKPVPD